MAPSLAESLGPCDIYVLRKRIKVQGRLATVQIACLVSASEGRPRFRGAGRMVWQVTFRKENGRWLVVKARPVELPGVRASVATIRQLRGYLGL